MKIGIDARWIFKELSGIGSYTRELIRHLARLERAGFVDAEVVVTRDYKDTYGKEFERACGAPIPDDVTLVGAFVRATKPVTVAHA